MKINGPKQTSGASATKKTSKAKPAESNDFGEFMSAGATQSSGSASAPQSITAVDALLAVQAVEDPTERAARKRMTLRAENVLKELDDLHMAMTCGQVSMSHMIDIADMVSTHREKVTDSKLAALLDEIDLRAQVELAKMRKALDNPRKSP